MVKKLYCIMLLGLGLLFFSCTSNTIDKEEAWNEFNKALEFTSSLQYYSINVTKVSESKTQSGKLIYTLDDQNRAVAYRKDGESESWWYEGLIYYQDKDDKLKKAGSINHFLEINPQEVHISYNNTNNIVLKNHRVSFELILSDTESYEVEAKLGKIFLEEITIEVKQSDVKKDVTSITYSYDNPGKKPNLSLPSNLWEYHY